MLTYEEAQKLADELNTTSAHLGCTWTVYPRAKDYFNFYEKKPQDRRRGPLWAVGPVTGKWLPTDIFHYSFATHLVVRKSIEHNAEEGLIGILATLSEMGGKGRLF